MELEKIVNEIKKGKELEEILKKFDWKFFENFVKEIFEANNFFVKQNFIFKTSRKYEIDLIASRNNIVLCADCKSWAAKGAKKGKIKAAVKKQEERVSELKKFLKRNPIAKNILKINSGSRFKSVIITLLEEDISKESKSIVIPIFKLNSFLVEAERFL